MAEAQVQAAAAEGNDFLTGLETLLKDLIDAAAGLKWVGDQLLQANAGAGCACLSLAGNLEAKVDELEGLIVEQSLCGRGVRHG